MSREASLRAFRRAVAELSKIDPDLRLYVASDTLCMLEGDSHDENGQPRQHAIIASAGQLRISGGDW